MEFFSKKKREYIFKTENNGSNRTLKTLIDIVEKR